VAERRSGTALLAAVVLAVMLGACSPGSGSGDPETPGGAGLTRASPATPTRPPVTFPWSPGRPQLGMHVYWIDNPRDTEEILRAKARRIVGYAAPLNVNSLALSFPVHTEGPRSSTVRAGRETPTADRIGAVLDELRRSRMRTTLRPLLDERSLQAADPKAWRGSIQPASRDRWFADYGQLLVPYLRVAQTNRVTTFVLGAELNSLEQDPRWAGLIAQARREYRGELGYSVNWDSFAKRKLRMPVDRLGVDAYFPVDADDDAPVRTLVTGWQQWLDRRTADALPDLVFDEVGAPAEKGGYRHPGVWGTAGHALDLAVQQRWFTAACQVARDREMAGLYWWKLDFHTDPATADPVRDHHDSFVGRPAEQAIKTCFAAWGRAG